ncbi:MAG: 50S ribosomal protein L34e [Candidatus Bathyarchaeia archaeon]
MPRRALRNRNIKRKNVRLPGGATTIHYHRVIAGRGVCASCGLPLRGIESKSLRRGAKSSKRPSRPFGGTLCHACVREMVRQGARVG